MADETIQSNDMDIDRQQLGSVYAKAMLGAAEKSGSSDTMVDELGSIVEELFDGKNGLEWMLSSPRLSVSEKLGILDKVLGGRVSDGLLKFLKVVCQHGRLDCVRQIRQAAKLQLNELRGRTEVRVTSAVELDQGQRDQISQRLRDALKSDVDMNFSVDPSVLGGLMVRIGDTIYDGSLSNKLLRLKAETVEKTVQQLRESADRFAASS